MIAETDHDRLVRMGETMMRVERRLEQVEREVKLMNDKANRWQGGLFVILGLGGVAGATLATLLAGYIKGLFQ